jgi:very-short-patch-repair endonuclease
LARPDFALASIKLIVEVDGARWPFTADRQVADLERHTRLEAQGWTVLQYTATRVLRDPAGVAAEMSAAAARLGRASGSTP